MKAIVALVLACSCLGYAQAAGVWDASTGITSSYNPPISLTPSNPVTVGTEVMLHLHPIIDVDHRFTEPIYHYYDYDSFLNSDAYTWAVKNSGGTPVGSFRDGDNTSNMPFPDVYWIAPSTPTSNLTVYVTCKDDPEALGIGETGTRDDPDKQWSLGGVRVGAAYISGLAGNVAGSYISGTGCWVRMYIDNMHYSMDNTISVQLAGVDMATGSSHVKVSPVSPAGQPKLRTDANGDWQSSADKGWVYFDSTHLLPDASTGNLKVKIVPATGAAYYSDVIGGVTLYNKAYILGNETGCPNTASGSVDNVKTQCISMNHTTDHSTYSHKDLILENMEFNTVFYIYSHGRWDHPSYPNMTIFLDCDTTVANIAGHCITPSEVSGSIALKGSATPAYNIVHIDTCDSSGDGTNTHNDLAIAFGILNSDGTAKSDRAYLGFNGPSEDDIDRVDWTYTVWSHLSAGDTIGAAVAAANTSYNPGGTAYIHGDSNTTLHKVY